MVGRGDGDAKMLELSLVWLENAVERWASAVWKTAKVGGNVEVEEGDGEKKERRRVAATVNRVKQGEAGRVVEKTRKKLSRWWDGRNGRFGAGPGPDSRRSWYRDELVCVPAKRWCVQAVSTELYLGR